MERTHLTGLNYMTPAGEGRIDKRISLSKNEMYKDIADVVEKELQEIAINLVAQKKDADNFIRIMFDEIYECDGRTALRFCFALRGVIESRLKCRGCYNVGDIECNEYCVTVQIKNA